ncbi:hypothetical protein BDA96_03G036800 [Sorghum bicolor]|uniref:Uncharacterized protein n=1 Tax=Sorghum bicolor TaxID=4558 RepID=A0A921R913_SORBI|nr:hypothetical protein BDA96_03G036800 [Sorghum bicolor]
MDLKLLLGAGFMEVLNAVFPVLACRKPANTTLIPTKQTKKPGANHSHHERLLGVARLLSQMSEPVIKAAIEITFLLARSFFIDLCMAVFSLLARVRMLLDVVSIYNKVTDLTDRKQAAKIGISGVQAFREYYPSMNDACTVLECVWVKDKFVLHEKVNDICQEIQVEDQKCCDPQHETLKVAFVAVGNPEVTGAALETKSSEVNKKQRLDTISPSNIQSGLYNKLLDCETAENSRL